MLKPLSCCSVTVAERPAGSCVLHVGAMLLAVMLMAPPKLPAMLDGVIMLARRKGADRAWHSRPFRLMYQ